MFRNVNTDKLELKMERDPELRKIITQMADNHRLALSTISHEIRNPLTLIYSALQLIQAQYPDIQEDRHWSTLISDVDFVIDFVGNLGSLSNSSDVSIREFNIKRMLESIVLCFAFSLEGTGIEFTSRIDPDLRKFLGDKIKIEEVLLNLLGNAKEAILCQEKEVLKEKPGKIDMYVYRIRGGQVTIRIKDNGCGIDSYSMQHIFEPFVTYKEEGTGLGLSICKKVAEAHHGSLHCNSVYGKGSTFVLVV